MSDRPLPAVIRPQAPAALRHELELAEGYAASALAPSTRKAYERDWLVFATWCAERGAQAIPATVAALLAAEADRGFRPVTIGRRAAAIAAAHRAQDHPNPCDSGAVAAVMSGIRREHGTRPLRRAAPLELDPLDVEDLEFDTARGLKIVIRGSKTDQERAGATVAVPYARTRDRCAVRALQAWLAAAAIHRGPVFRQMLRGDKLTDRRLSDQSVALIVKRRAQAAGLPPTFLSGHSLRAGYATAAAAAGVEGRKVANVTEPSRPTRLHPRRDRVRRRRRSALVTWVRELLFPHPTLGPPPGAAPTTSEKSPD